MYPLITAVLIQVQFENASKWKSLSKQICDALIPQLNKHSLYLDSDEAVQMLQKLISHLDPPIVHESLIGLLQTFANKRLEDFNFSVILLYSYFCNNNLISIVLGLPQSVGFSFDGL